MSETATQQWLTLRELAQRWRTSEDTLRRQCLAGELPYIKVGSQYRVHYGTVDRIERRAKEQDLTRAVRNVRRNRQRAASGVDHFGDGQ